MRPTLYEFTGGDAAFLALATAHHARCLADPELNHPFSHGNLNPQHVARLAAYWAEVMGGPPRFTALPADQADVLRMHAGNGDMTDLGRRFVACFVRAADFVGLPADAAFRAALREYMEWAVADVLAHHDADGVARTRRVPRWSWAGLADADRRR